MREGGGNEAAAEGPTQATGSMAEAPVADAAGGDGDDGGDDMAAMLGFSGFGGSKKK